MKESRLRVLTWNLWADALPWQRWEKRREAVFRVLLDEAPDVFGLQETSLIRIHEIQRRMPGYEWIGEPRDSATKAEYNPIFYATARCRLTQSQTVWLSPTPEVSSRGWDASYPRILVQARLERRDAASTPFVLWNTHLDHWGAKSQAHGLDYILTQISTEPPHLPVILIGDFNFKPTSPSYRKITQAALLQDAAAAAGAPHEVGNGKTWRGLPGGGLRAARLDYIFTRNLVVHSYEVRREAAAGAKASDHFAVRADVSFS